MSSPDIYYLGSISRAPNTQFTDIGLGVRSDIVVTGGGNDSLRVDNVYFVGDSDITNLLRVDNYTKAGIQSNYLTMRVDQNYTSGYPRVIMTSVSGMQNPIKYYGNSSFRNNSDVIDFLCAAVTSGNWVYGLSAGRSHLRFSATTYSGSILPGII